MYVATLSGEIAVSAHIVNLIISQVRRSFLYLALLAAKAHCVGLDYRLAHVALELLLSITALLNAARF